MNVSKTIQNESDYNSTKHEYNGERGRDRQRDSMKDICKYQMFISDNKYFVNSECLSGKTNRYNIPQWLWTPLSVCMCLPGQMFLSYCHGHPRVTRYNPTMPRLWSVFRSSRTVLTCWSCPGVAGIVFLALKIFEIHQSKLFTTWLIMYIKKAYLKSYIQWMITKCNFEEQHISTEASDDQHLDSM